MMMGGWACAAVGGGATALSSLSVRLPCTQGMRMLSSYTPHVPAGQGGRGRGHDLADRERQGSMGSEPAQRF